MSSSETITYHPLEHHFASIVYSHDTSPDWYYILLFAPVFGRNNRQAWTGWAFLPWGFLEKNYFEIVE